MAAPKQSPEHVALGESVRAIRLRARLSQEALHARAGLHRNYIGAIERGEINPTYRVLLALAGGLDVRVSDLIRLTEERLRRNGHHV